MLYPGIVERHSDNVVAILKPPSESISSTQNFSEENENLYMELAKPINNSCFTTNLETRQIDIILIKTKALIEITKNRCSETQQDILFSSFLVIFNESMQNILFAYVVLTNKSKEYELIFEYLRPKKEISEFNKLAKYVEFKLKR